MFPSHTTIEWIIKEKIGCPSEILLVYQTQPHQKAGFGLFCENDPLSNIFVAEW